MRTAPHGMKRRLDVASILTNSAAVSFMTAFRLFSLFGLLVSRVSAVGFAGIHGDYCFTRHPVQCCINRDDECTASILENHLCYCDTFCEREDGNDCCPDYNYVCKGIKPEPEIKDGCHDRNGVLYPVGGTYKINCNTCMCQPGMDGYRFVCKNEVPCLIQEDIYETIHRGRYSWQVQNYSQFWGQTLDEGITYRLGTLFPEESVKNMNEMPIETIPPLPDRFDAREKWPGFIHPIRDQGNCGASWAFSTTATSADRLAIQSGGKFHAVLSPQQLLSCNQMRQRGCNGGYLDRAWWYIRKYGVVSEECYPYTSGHTSQQGTCRIPRSQYRTDNIYCVSGSSDNRVFKMTPSYRVSSKEEEIMTEVITNGPVQATFLVHEDFFMYKGGVYRHENLAAQKGPLYTHSGYHSVRILGWGTDHSTGRPIKYWLCDNSWGENWGENGYFRILRGQNHCDIESFIVGAWGKGSKLRKRRYKLHKTMRKRL